VLFLIGDGSCHGVSCGAGSTTFPLLQQSVKHGFVLDERAKRSCNQKRALQCLHLYVLSPKSMYSIK